MKAPYRTITVLLMTLCLLLSSLVAAPAALAAEAQAPAVVEEIAKVTIQLTRTPVALLNVSESTAKVSSANASLVSLTWYDPNGNPASGTFEHVKYRMEIVVRANDGYVFASGLKAYVNNSNEGLSVAVNGTTATITREMMAAVWSPNIIKHPGDEPVMEGGLVSYVSTALYATGLSWELTSPDGSETIDAKDAPSRFPPLTINNNGTDKIILNHVPYALNGWSIRAVFTGAMNTVTRSRASVLQVTPDPNAAAAPAEEPAPAPAEAPNEAPFEAPAEEPAEEPAEAPADAPAEEPEPEPEPEPPHEHAFAEKWSMDEEKHWRECPDDGERTEEAAHDFEWITITPATRKTAGEERGVCSVCGYQTVRELAFSGGDDLISRLPIEYPLIGIPALILLLVIIQEIKVFRRRRAGEE